MEVKAQVTQVSTPPAGSAQPTGRSAAHPAGPGLVPPTGPIERFMSALIRKLAWSRLSDPRVAVAVSASGLLLGMLLGATAPNAETLPVKLPLSYLLPSLSHQHVLASLILYASDILACLGLAGMLWAHSQGWRPNPRHLLLVSSAIVAVLVCLTPVGSSDTASYAAYGRIAAQGGNPYVTNPAAWLGHHSAYTQAVGTMWRSQSSVYGPFATVIQSFAASIGGPHVATTVWVLMILNGAVFIGVGYLLLKTSDDPVRATLFWTANPVLIQQLVSGGHLDTFVAAAAICAIQVARRVPNALGAVLVGLGLALPLLWRREFMRTARIAAVSIVTLAIGYSAYGLVALKPLFGGLQLVTLTSPWRVFELTGQALGVGQSTMVTIISF